MRRYFLSLTAVAAMVAMISCEKESATKEDNTPQEPIIEHTFGEVVEIEVDKTDVTIVATMPRMTVDGYDNPLAKIKLGYEAHMADMVSEELFQTEYGVRDSCVVFKLRKLAQMTEYVARIYIEDERYNYSAVSEDFTFGTAKKDPKCEFDCDINIEPRGLFATITLDNISYTADGKPHPLRNIELEYCRHGYIYDESVTIEYDAKDIIDGRLVMELPAEGESYLAYSTLYEYTIRVWPEQTIVPEDPVHGNAVLMGEFSTLNAEIEVDYSTPILSLEILDKLEGTENVGGSRITVQVDKVEILYDGVPSGDYNPEYYRYDEVIQLCYRQKRSEEWTCQNIWTNEEGGVESSFILDNPEHDTIYEVCLVVYAGSDRTVGHYSEIVEINVNPTTSKTE